MKNGIISKRKKSKSEGNDGENGKEGMRYNTH